MATSRNGLTKGDRLHPDMNSYPRAQFNGTLNTSLTGQNKEEVLGRDRQWFRLHNQCPIPREPPGDN